MKRTIKNTHAQAIRSYRTPRKINTGSPLSIYPQQRACQLSQHLGKNLEKRTFDELSRTPTFSVLGFLAVKISMGYRPGEMHTFCTLQQQFRLWKKTWGNQPRHRDEGSSPLGRISQILWRLGAFFVSRRCTNTSFTFLLLHIGHSRNIAPQTYLFAGRVAPTREYPAQRAVYGSSPVWAGFSPVRECIISFVRPTTKKIHDKKKKSVFSGSFESIVRPA